MPSIDLLYACADKLLEAVVAYYEEGGLDELPDRRYVSPGLPAWDFCEGCGGQLTVYLDRTFGWDGEAETALPLDYLGVRAAEYLVEVALPVAVINDAGEAPDAQLIDDDARLVLRQPTAIVNGLAAAYRAGDLAGCKGLTLLGWEALGPDGGFAGGRQRVRWQLTES